MTGSGLDTTSPGETPAGGTTGRLRDKVAIVSGGASGIGEGIVRRSVREGARVVVADIDAAKGRALADDLDGCATFVGADVTREESWQAAVDEARGQFARSTYW